MRSLADCTNIEIKAEIYREEQGKEIIFRHARFNLVCDVIKMDGCVFTDTSPVRRCDFLFLFDKNKQEYKFLNNKLSIVYYVELKGIDLASACEQLLNSIEKTRNQIADFDINALVVSTRKFVPQYDNNEFYRAVKRMIRKDIVFELTPCIINL